MSPPPDRSEPDPESDPDDPLGRLPRVARRHARLAMRLRRGDGTLRRLLDEVEALIGASPRLETVDVLPRASGLKRPGAIAQFSWPRLGTRIGLGIEPSLAHAVVDRLLGFDRKEPEHKLQVSPIEWGVLGFVVARLLDRLAEAPGPLGPWDLYLDRVGPEPFPPEGLGPVVTLAWPLRVGPASGVVRLWVPEMLVGLVLVDEPLPPPPGDPVEAARRLGGLALSARIEAGIGLDPGRLPDLVADDLLPIATAGVPLGGPPEAPEGPVRLALDDAGNPRGRLIPAAIEGGRRLVITGPVPSENRHQEAPAVPTPSDQPPPLPADAPIGLVVELARLDLPLARLADLKPGDVLDLDRDAAEPVAIRSGGTLVARGTLVRLDEGLGVRISQVFG